MGELDEVSLYRGALTDAAIAALAVKQTTPHKIEIVEPATLWGGDPVPKAADQPMLQDVCFSVIKPYEFQKDGYRFLHGVALPESRFPRADTGGRATFSRRRPGWAFARFTPLFQ